MKRGKYEYMGLRVKYTLRKSSCDSKIPTGQQKNDNKQLIALLLKSFCLWQPSPFPTRCESKWSSEIETLDGQSWSWLYQAPGDIVSLAVDPPSNMINSNKISSSTRCAWYVLQSQNFPPRAQYECEEHFHNVKSWKLCCIIKISRTWFWISVLNDK